MDDNSTVATRLRELRKRAGNPTQRRVADQIGCAPRTYQNWEQAVTGHSGKVIEPSWRYAEALARLFGTTPGYILYGIDPDTARPEIVELNAKLDDLTALVRMLIGATPSNGQTAAPDAPSTDGEPSRRRRSGVDGTGRPERAQGALY